jgi:hypothetical protein
MRLTQTRRQNRPAGLRVTILMACSSLAIGSVVWLMVAFWPSSNTPLPEEVAAVKRPVVAASAPMKAVSGTNLASGATRGGAGQGNRVPIPALRTGVVNAKRTPQPVVIPVLTETNRIRSPLPWRNGPPERTPQPGAPALKAGGTPQPNGPVMPNAMNGTGTSRRPPYMPPPRGVHHPPTATRPPAATSPSPATDATPGAGASPESAPSPGSGAK